MKQPWHGTLKHPQIKEHKIRIVVFVFKNYTNNSVCLMGTMHNWEVMLVQIGG